MWNPAARVAKCTLKCELIKSDMMKQNVTFHISSAQESRVASEWQRPCPSSQAQWKVASPLAA